MEVEPECPSPQPFVSHSLTPAWVRVGLGLDASQSPSGAAQHSTLSLSHATHCTLHASQTRTKEHRSPTHLAGIVQVGVEAHGAPARGQELHLRLVVGFRLLGEV